MSDFSIKAIIILLLSLFNNPVSTTSFSIVGSYVSRGGGENPIKRIKQWKMISPTTSSAHTLLSSNIGNESNDKSTNMNANNTVPSTTDASSKARTLEAPTVEAIIKFAIPAIGIWLCGPLLSLIDTSAVGIFAGTTQQAALNPAITITDDGALLVSFMYTATTNLIASAFTKDQFSTDKTPTKTRTVFTNALQIASLVGIVFGAALLGGADFLLRALLGKGGRQVIDPQVYIAAKKYIQIRALGMPAAVVIGTAQSACLGMKDIRSPLMVMIAAAVINFIGDCLFIPLNHPWMGGAAGAAIATTLSQYSAMIMFILWLCLKPSSQQTTSEQNHLKSTRGFLHGHFDFLQLFKLPPSAKIRDKFRHYFLPVTTTSIGRVSGYIAMSHVVSNVLGTVDMAAQHIVLSFFLCFIPMCDSINQTAQAFVPGIASFKGDATLRLRVLKQTVLNFLKAGGIFGAILAALVSLMPFVSDYFTHDPLVVASVNATTPYLLIFYALSGIYCAGEGLLLGQRDLGFITSMFTVYFFAVPYFLLRIKNAALAGVTGIGLKDVWRVFTIYQIIRTSIWGLRLNYLVSRKPKLKEA